MKTSLCAAACVAASWMAAESKAVTVRLRSTPSERPRPAGGRVAAVPARFRIVLLKDLVGKWLSHVGVASRLHFLMHSDFCITLMVKALLDSLACSPRSGRVLLHFANALSPRLGYAAVLSVPGRGGAAR